MHDGSFQTRARFEAKRPTDDAARPFAAHNDEHLQNDYGAPPLGKRKTDVGALIIRFGVVALLAGGAIAGLYYLGNDAPSQIGANIGEAAQSAPNVAPPLPDGVTDPFAQPLPDSTGAPTDPVLNEAPLPEPLSAPLPSEPATLP